MLGDSALTQQQRDAFTEAALGQAPQLLALDADAASLVGGGGSSVLPHVAPVLYGHLLYSCCTTRPAKPPALFLLQLVLDCFPERQTALLAQLAPHPDLQFAFLQSLVAIHQQQRAVGDNGGSSSSSSPLKVSTIWAAIASQAHCRSAREAY